MTHIHFLIQQSHCLNQLTFNSLQHPQQKIQKIFDSYNSKYKFRMEAVDNKGKDYTLADDKGTKQMLVRCKTGTYILPSYLSSTQHGTKIFGKASFLLQTRNMQFVVAASQKHCAVFSTSLNKLIFEQDFNYIYDISFSSNQQFVQILDKIDSNQGKTLIYSLPTMQKVTQFKENALTNYYLKHSYPLVRFTSDDKKCFRYNSKVIEVYNSQWKLEKDLNSGPVEFFEVSKISKSEDYLLASLFLDKKTNSGLVRLFTHESEQPFYEKAIKKAEQIKLRFSPKSNKFLMELQTYYDPTGKSYYGQYGLYIFNDQNRKINKVQTFKGPVHDFSWDHKGENFIVISGFMPAHSVMFSEHNKQVFEFGVSHRNKIIWGNLGRFLCLAGFGNLNGEMEMWDLQTKTKIGVCKSNSASHCEWAPDDRKLITSIVTPRLRVDNCYKIFSYTGTMIHKASYEDTELYEAIFSKTEEYKKQQVRGLSPGRKIGQEEKKEQAKFMSFGAALGLGTTTGLNTYVPPVKKNEGPTLVPGQHPEDIPKKRKRNRNKKEPNLEAES